MQLVEEYLNRHNLNNVPLMKHIVDVGYVFSRKETSSNITWTVLQINYVEQEAHPGYYQITITKPRHNGFTEGVMFEKSENIRIEWGDYEAWMLNWMNKNKKTIVPETNNSAVLTAWEMFVYSCDSWMSLHSRNEDLFQSLNYEASPDARMAALTRSLNVFKDKKLNSAWREHVRTYTNNYCGWMAESAGKNA